MNQRCTAPPALRHDVMRSLKMEEERKRSGLQDYSEACTVGHSPAQLDTLSLVPTVHLLSLVIDRTESSPKTTFNTCA